MRGVIGAYELLDRVGAGGMGEVWRARHRSLGRLVAVKLVRPGALGASAEADRVVLARFEREARVAAGLRSPHALPALDFGVAEDGRFYQVMDLLDGLDLQALVERFGPQPPGRVASLLRQACDALAEAHGMGLVHRDVKPSNLYLSRSGTQVDFLRVLDFGLARPASAADAGLTLGGVVPGSPAYLAPEVIRGGEADGRSDVYALGCVAWWLLTGDLVFPARTSLELVVGHLEREPGDLPGVPDALADTVRDCLVKRPDGRPTAKDLSARLAAARVRWTESDANTWWETHPGATVPRPAPPVGTNGNVASARFHAESATTAPRVPLPLGPVRDEVSRTLRRHFEMSRIDLAGLEDRLSVASRGGTPDAVRAALAGLPEEPPPVVIGPVAPSIAPRAIDPEPSAQPTALVPRRPALLGQPEKVVAIFSTLARAGPWQPTPKSRVVTVFGNAEIDLRDAILAPGLTELRCVAVFGNVTVIAPPDLPVEVGGMGVLGSFAATGGRGRDRRGDRPWVRVTGVAVFGNVEVQVRETGRTALEDAVARGVEAVQGVVDRISDGAARGFAKAKRRREQRDE